MHEVYTCICGGQKFSIHDTTITCPNCGRIYGLVILKKRGLESPKDFNKRIRKEEGK